DPALPFTGERPYGGIEPDDERGTAGFQPSKPVSAAELHRRAMDTRGELLRQAADTADSIARTDGERGEQRARPAAPRGSPLGSPGEESPLQGSGRRIKPGGELEAYTAALRREWGGPVRDGSLGEARALRGRWLLRPPEYPPLAAAVE